MTYRALRFRRVRKNTESDCLLRHVCLSAWNKVASYWTDFHEIQVLFENLQREIQVRLKSDTSSALFALRPKCICVIIAFWTALIRRSASDRTCRETQISCRFWDIVEKYGRAGQATDDDIIRRMRFACWITMDTSTHSEYLIVNAFSRQQWLRERVSLLHYTYIACLGLSSTGAAR